LLFCEGGCLWVATQVEPYVWDTPPVDTCEAGCECPPPSRPTPTGPEDQLYDFCVPS
jgi:hypothetical protein